MTGVGLDQTAEGLLGHHDQHQRYGVTFGPKLSELQRFYGLFFLYES